MTISLEQIENAISSLQVMTAFLDCEFNFIRVNLAYASATGHTPDYFIGKNHFSLYPDAENEAIFRHVLESQEPYTVRAKPFAHPDQPERGTTYWDWRLQPLIDKDKLEGLSLILIDVTEHVRRATQLEQITQQLTASEVHYRALFNGGSDAIFILTQGDINSPARILEANDVSCQRLGYIREELVGHPPAIFNAPGYPKNYAEVMQNIATYGRALFETIHVCKDGRHIPTEVNLRLITLEGQTRIFAIARDISERKQLEDSVQRNRRNLQALLNATMESAILLDENYTILAANNVAARRFGFSTAELIGKRDDELMPPELVASRRKRLAEAKQKREFILFEDIRNNRNLQITINPIIDADNEIRRFAIYALDITEQHQIEAAERLLTRINQKTLEGMPIQELFDLICHDTAEGFGLALAWIGKRMEDGTMQLQSIGGNSLDYINKMKQIGVRWDDSPLGRGPTGTCVRTGALQIRHLDDIRFSPWKQAATDGGLKAVLAVPLILRGNIYGAFTLYSTNENQFDSPSFQKRVSLLASKACLALELAMEQEQIKLLSTALTSARNAVMITNAAGIIQWVNPAFSELSGYSSSELVGRQPSILKSGKHDAEYYQQLWKTLKAGDVWCSDTHEKRKDGVIYTVQQTITPIRDDNGDITHYVAVHEDVTAKLETQRHIQHLANHDQLTGLPNRSLFYDRLETKLQLAKREKIQIALLFIDLDGFKQVNDQLGHHIGDLLLMAVAQRLLACVRESDTVARLGGDEFVAILYNINGESGASRVAEKIIAELSTPFLLENQKAHIGASLGIALSQPEELSDKLTNRADAAMYQAKREGKRTYRIAPESST